ncbi:hypothetical protein [Massilibacterium senegalense]|uniref:hypothetical protein n=1 Tax=Massilibacterium senegalense TaxID=1632858 RepID=UPI000782EE13|nr:hypothetical protein [Massilibacterium senegalense]
MEKKPIDKEDIIENLSHIKTLINHKQDYGKQTAPYFIVWGCIWIIGFLISSTSSMSVINTAWILLAVVGWFFSGIIFLKQKKNYPMPKFLNNQFKMLWIGFLFIFYIFVFLIGSKLLPLSFHHLALYSFLLISILYILLGIILTRTILFMGLWLIVLGTATYSFLSDYMYIIFAILGGGCLLLTGILLNRKGIKNE